MEFVSEFKRFYSQFDQQAIEGLGDFYTENVTFIDPLHRVNGLAAVKYYFSEMCSGLQSCRFEFLGETIDDKSIWFKWVMHYQHPKLKQGQALQLNGASYLLLEETEKGVRVRQHEDFYDMGAMVYEHLPVLGFCLDRVKRQLTQ